MMYRLLQAALLAVIAAYIAWMTVDLQHIHSELSQLQQAIARDNRTRPDSRTDGQSSPGLAANHVEVTVAGLNYIFNPKKLVVKVGTRVTWTNATAARHSVTSVGPRFFDRFIPAHGHVSILFSAVGAFPYYCRYHPYQRGEVVVVP